VREHAVQRLFLVSVQHPGRQVSAKNGSPRLWAISRRGLPPDGLPGARGVVVHGGDGGVDLIPTGATGGRRRLQDAHALGDLAGVARATVLPVERDDAPSVSSRAG
jgi:hypothetical protein